MSIKNSKIAFSDHEKQLLRNQLKSIANDIANLLSNYKKYHGEWNPRGL